MNSSHEDAVLSFDLDFLHPTTNNIPVQALKQRYIGQIKKRIIRVDALNNHCNTLKIDLSNKNKELELIKKKLESTNQEHTQTSLEYKDILESYSKCEMECQNLKSAVNTYQEKYYEAENRVHAGKSHVVQLQQLVKQYERQIETLQQNEKKRTDKTLREGLEKELLQWKKKYKKEITEWQTKYDTLLKQLQEMKSISRKLNNHSSPNDKCSSEIGDSMSFDENSDNEDDTVDFISDVISQNGPQSKLDVNKNSSAHNMRMEAFSDTKIESVSVDTGCGSSLASSDNEKWLNSPDYYFSPINGESANKVPTRKGVDIATSPIMLLKTNDTASSPIPSIVAEGEVSDTKKLLHNPDHYFSPINKETVNKMSCKLVNTATSPMLPVKTTERGNSPIPSLAAANVDINDNTANKPALLAETTERASSPIQSLVTILKVDVKMVDIATNTMSPFKTTDRAISPMPSSEMTNTASSPIKHLNTCQNMEEDSRNDSEIEMIFSNMRFDHKLITPIPKSPKRMHWKPKMISPILKSPKRDGIETLSAHCPEAAIAKDLSEAAKQEAFQARRDIAKTNESQKVLISNLANLMKDMFYIKTFLKSKFAAPGTALEQLNDSLNYKDLLENVSCFGLNDENQNMSTSVNLCKQQDFDKSLPSPKLTKKSRITILSDEVIKPADVEHIIYNEYENETVSDAEKEMCVPEECAKENEASAAQGIPMGVGNEVKVQSPIESTKKRKVKRFRKLTNLAKYRYKCEPRNCKIKRETPPLRRPLMKPKQVPCRRIKKVTRNDTSATLNDKQIYAKAVKVMAELNAKTKDNAESAPNTGNQRKTPDQTKHNNNTTHENKKSSVPDSNLPSPTPNLTSPLPDRGTEKPGNTTTTPIKSRRRSTRTSKTFDFSPENTVKSPTALTGSSTIAQRDPKITSPTLVIITPSPLIASLSPKKGQTSSVIACPSTPPRRSTRLSSVASTPKGFNKSPNSDAVRKRLSITSPQPEAIASPPGIIESPKSKKAPPVSSEVSKNCTLERKRKLSQNCDVQSKRVLRSSSITQTVGPKEQTAMRDNVGSPVSKEEPPADVSTCDAYGSFHPKDSILCSMIQKYGVRKVKPGVRHVPDAVLKNVYGTIEGYMTKIREGPAHKDNITMVELVDEVKAMNYKHFVSGLTKYLTHPERKMELFGKLLAPPAPQMTKSEAVLLFVLRQVRTHWRAVDVVAIILSSLEHTLFKLSRTPEFGVIESVSHFYALVCRYFGLQSRLKVFMLDAMYCIQYKSAPLIKECLEVWPHIIPLAHMNAAKLPLMTIFVYLLHYYKCEDRFSRVQEIRNILCRKYSYQATEWNETKILEMIGNSISELKDIPCETKMLRLAIIILSKRQGPRWTQNNIIKKLGQFIEKSNVPEHVTAFCVSLIGPLMRPYPIDMKVYCEVAINQLLNTLNTTKSKAIEEATLSSMLIMSRHNTQRVTEILLSRKMDRMSPELSKLFRVHIRMKPLNMWIKSLSGNSVN